jgi:hypothetical protein
MAEKYKMAGYQNGGILKMAGNRNEDKLKWRKITNVGEKMV